MPSRVITTIDTSCEPGPIAALGINREKPQSGQVSPPEPMFAGSPYAAGNNVPSIITKTPPAGFGPGPSVAQPATLRWVELVASFKRTRCGRVTVK